MHRSSLVPETPSTTQQAPSAAVRPASSEQALDMLNLMMADIIAQAEGTMAGWGMPLDDQDAARAKAQEVAAKEDDPGLCTQARLPGCPADLVGRRLRSHAGGLATRVRQGYGSQKHTPHTRSRRTLMHFVEKEGQRLAVFDHLISTETGQHIEIPITSPEMEASMLEAEKTGQGALARILDPRDPGTALLLKNHTTG